MSQPPSVPLTPEQERLIAQRYGPARRHSRSARIAVGVVVVAFLAWVAWAALLQSHAPVRWRFTGTGAVSDTEVVVRFQVDKQAGATVVCTVRALDASGEVVGEATVQVAGSGTSVNVAYPLKVLRRPASAGVDSCTVARGP